MFSRHFISYFFSNSSLFGMSFFSREAFSFHLYCNSILICFKKGRSKRKTMRYFRSLLFNVNGLGTRCSLFSRIFSTFSECPVLREEFAFLFQTFSRNDLPGEAPLSRGRSVFKKKKKDKNNGSEVFPDGLASCLETFLFSSRSYVHWERSTAVLSRRIFPRAAFCTQ